jgi:predicted RNase H-like HicB family nuclease
MLQDTVEITVEITDDEDYGTVYVASNDELGLVTDGQTFEELLDHLREVLELCLEEAEELNFVAAPRVILKMEMAYAETS